MFIRIIIYIFLVDIIIKQFAPQFFCLQPINFLIQVNKSFSLVCPRIIIDVFVETDILLPAVSAIIYNCKVATMYDSRSKSIYFFYRKNASGIFAMLISVTRCHSINCVSNYSPYFFRFKFFLIVINLDIDIKVKSNIGFCIVSNHVTA